MDSQDHSATNGKGSCDDIEREKSIWAMIQSKYDEGKYSGWQRLWGGIFVSALRIMERKCLRAAIFLSQKLANATSDEHEYNQCSEVTEALGNSYYNELGGGVIYAYPIQRLSEFEKRQQAINALTYFQLAIDLAALSDDKEPPEELHFMVGKVREYVLMYPKCFIRKIIKIEHMNFFRFTLIVS